MQSDGHKRSLPLLLRSSCQSGGLSLFNESATLRGASLSEGFAKPPRRLHEPFAEIYEPFAEVAYTEGSTKTPWRVHEASSKGPWMNSRVFLLDDVCNRVWSLVYCFFLPPVLLTSANPF